MGTRVSLVLAALASLGACSEKSSKSNPTPAVEPAVAAQPAEPVAATPVVEPGPTAAATTGATAPDEPAAGSVAAAAYTPLPAERFREIEAAMEQQDDWNPIALPGFSRDELARFYVDYRRDDPESVARWPKFAYEKLQRFEQVRPDVEQDVRLQLVLLQPPGPAAMYAMLMLLTPEQLSLIGF